MDYRESAKQVFELIGGKSNLISAAHCATRLRLVVADESVCKKGAIENVDGVKGVFSASGQLQIIFGTGTVNKVYEEFIAVAGITAASKEEVKQAAAKKGNPFQRAIKALGDVFVPIIPAIVASGLLMGLLEGICKVYPALAGSGTYTIEQRGFHLPSCLNCVQRGKGFRRQSISGSRYRYGHDPSGPPKRMVRGGSRVDSDCFRVVWSL